MSEIGPRGANRSVLSVLGLVVALIGGYGLTRGMGGLGPAAADDVLLARGLRSAIADDAGWVAGGATFLAVLVAWLGWRWLRRQLVSSAVMRRVEVEGGAGGRTLVDAGALATAVGQDLTTSDHVRTGQVRVVGGGGAPALILTAEVAPGADPAAVRAHVGDYVVPRARAALSGNDLGALLRLRLADEGTRAVE